MERPLCRPSVFQRGLVALSAVLSVGVALVAYRYLVPGLLVPDVIAANGFIMPWLPVHAAAAATALLIAPLQFRSQLRARRPKLHRLLGRLYVTGCLIGGATGFVLALGASTGPVSTVGFGSLAVVWVFATAQAWRLATRHDIVSHRDWMIRSFALTFAAVTLRLYLPIAQMLPVEFDDAYRAISFLCWVPNLLIAEVYLRQKRKSLRDGYARVPGLGVAS
jgi:uncharacterized membrane protein